MKKLSIMVVVVLSLCLVASFAFAGTTGKVASVDAGKGTIVISIDGKDETLTAEKGVDLGAVKAGDQVIVEIDKGMLKSMKKKPRAVVGC